MRARILPLVLIASAMGCSSETDSGPPPGSQQTPSEFDVLFDGLAAPTPNVLRGVWSYTTTSPEGTSDLRFRFAADGITAAVRCTYNRQGLAPLTIGQRGALDTKALDAAKGSFVLGTTLSFEAAPDQRVCRGVLAADNYSFDIKGTSMTLFVVGKTGDLTLTKSGD